MRRQSARPVARPIAADLDARASPCDVDSRLGAKAGRRVRPMARDRGEQDRVAPRDVGEPALDHGEGVGCVDQTAGFLYADDAHGFHLTRTDKRSVGKRGFSKCRTWWSPFPSKKHTKQ